MENALSKFFLLGLLAGLFYWWARKDILGSRFILLLSIFMVSVSLDVLTVHFAIPFVTCLLAAGIYGLMAIDRQSNVIWILALLTFGQYVGVMVVYAHGNYYVGLLAPVHFLILGLALIALPQTNVFNQYPFRCFATTTFVIGIIYANIALGVLSTVGYHPKHYTQKRRLSEQPSSAQLMGWSLVWFASCVALGIYGILFNRASAQRLASVFIILNVYIKFFEYFWQETTKVFFLTVLGTCLCFLGYRMKLYFFPTLKKRHSKK